MSSTCVVFAKSEASGLLREGWPKNKVLAAYCAAMAHRVVTLLERIEVALDHQLGHAGRVPEDLHRGDEARLVPLLDQPEGDHRLQDL